MGGRAVRLFPVSGGSRNTGISRDRGGGVRGPPSKVYSLSGHIPSLKVASWSPCFAMYGLFGGSRRSNSVRIT